MRYPSESTVSVTAVHVYKLMKFVFRIPDYEQRLKSLLYKKQFTPTVDDLLSRISTVTEACREVNGSKRLKKLLGIILDLGMTTEEFPPSLNVLAYICDRKLFELWYSFQRFRVPFSIAEPFNRNKIQCSEGHDSSSLPRSNHRKGI